MQIAHTVLRVLRDISPARYVCLPSGGLLGFQSTTECIDPISVDCDWDLDIDV